MITSAAQGEGKSTTLANLAVTLAQAGKKVLIADCDLRRPTQHKIFWVSNEMGITSHITQNVEIESLIKPTQAPGVELLTTGPVPPNPSELLGSQKMRLLLETLSARYDLVIIDSPPLVPVTDAVILSTLVDGVLLVIKSAAVEREMVKAAKDSLINVRARIIGTVLNDVKSRDKGYYYQYKY